MALWRSKGARKDAVRGTAPIEVRKSDGLLFTGPGVLPGSASPLVTGTAGWAYQVGVAGFVTTRGASDGVHLFGNDGVVTVGATGAGSTVPVAPGAGLSRIDVIWVRHPAAGENSDTVSEPTFGVTSGIASASPVAPTIPIGALELARNTMLSSATSTSSTGNSITNSAPRAWSGVSGAGVPAPRATAANGTPTSVGGVPSQNTFRDDILGSYTFTALAGRQYRATCDNLLMNGNAGDVYEVKLSYASGTSAPGVADPSVARTRAVIYVTGSAGRVPVPLSGVFAPGAGVFTIAVLVTRLLGSGIGTPVSEGTRQLYVQDMGPIAPAPVA